MLWWAEKEISLSLEKIRMISKGGSGNLIIFININRLNQAINNEQYINKLNDNEQYRWNNQSINQITKILNKNAIIMNHTTYLLNFLTVSNFNLNP